MTQLHGSFILEISVTKKDHTPFCTTWAEPFIPHAIFDVTRKYCNFLCKLLGHTGSCKNDILAPPQFLPGLTKLFFDINNMAQQLN